MRVQVQAAPDESAWGGGGLVVGWELGFGLVGLGADNQGKEGEGGKGAARCTQHLQPPVQMQILVQDGFQDAAGGRVGERVVCMWVNLASYSPKFCCAARAREDDTNRRTQRQRE